MYYGISVWESTDRGGIHQKVEIEGKNLTFEAVNIWPCISILFTNINWGSVFGGPKWGICACVAEK